MAGVWVIAVLASKEINRAELRADESQELVVGSSVGSCDFVVEDSSVSRRHLSLRLRLGQVAAKDLGSTNGTRYQGSKLNQALLPLTAVLKLGRVTLRFEPVHGPTATRFGSLSTVNPGMRKVLNQLATVAPTDATVLIDGPTGSGKELCVRTLHQHSSRAKGRLETLDCGSMSASLAASELFGHERGAFTGAQSTRAGALERAHGGTLFLDEVGELPLELQPLLLRGLEARQVKRVGGTDFLSVDVRVISTSCRDLNAEVKAGRFRADLLHRLSVVHIELPALAQRLDDLALLAREMLEAMGPRAAGMSLSPETVKDLSRQPWPGNLRELRNFLERAASLGHLEVGPAAAAPWPEDYRQAREEAIDAFERDFARHLLRRHGGNVSRAARDAGIARVYLHRIIKKHGLDPGR